MNFPITESDFLATMSTFAELLTIIKVKMKHLEHDMRHHINDYLKEVIHVNAKKDVDSKNYNTENVILDKRMELWMHDLKKQIKHLDFFSRAAVLRMFFYLTNYLYVLRTPITRSYDHPRKLPVYNIEFPKVEKNEIPRLLLKDLSKLKRKKNLIKIDTCG